MPPCPNELSAFVAGALLVLAAVDIWRGRAGWAVWNAVFCVVNIYFAVN